ncbi:MAG: hypothetical protein K6G64_09810 [Eubacterium sp.]|nr:hypothetical protein [Eubacterium sp.]
MKNGTRKIVAVMCAIALVISSMTIYKKKEVQAATAFSSLNYTIVDGMFTDVAYSVVPGSNLTGFGSMDFYNENYMQVIGNGNSGLDEATLTVVDASGIDVTNRLTWSNKVAAQYQVKLNDLGTENNYYLFTFTNRYTGTVKVAVKIGTPTSDATFDESIPAKETTTEEPVEPVVDGTELLDDVTVTSVATSEVNDQWMINGESGNLQNVDFTGLGIKATVPGLTSGNPWGYQLAQRHFKLRNGFYYRATATIKSDVARTVSLKVQETAGWAVIGEVHTITLEAGVPATIDYVFQSTITTESDVFCLQLGNHQGGQSSETANLDIYNLSLKVYNTSAAANAADNPTTKAESTTSAEPTTQAETTTPEQESELVTECVTSSSLEVEGFQIKVNDNDTSAKTGFRVIVKVPKSGTIDGHTVDHFGTVYTLDDNNTGVKANNIYNKYHTILNSTPVIGKKWEFEGINNGERTVGYVRTTEALLPNWKPSDQDNDYYAMTMYGIDSAMLEHTIFIRPYFVDSNGVIVYAAGTVSTSIARIANDLYVNSKMSNKAAHDYLFNNILNSSYTQHNYYHLTQPVEYGWGQSVYVPTTAAP